MATTSSDFPALICFCMKPVWPQRPKTGLLAQKSSILKLVLPSERCSASIPFSFNQYYSRHLATAETSSGEGWHSGHWQRKSPPAFALSCIDSFSCGLSGKKGLRVNFLAVICRKGASTICCRPEHEKHYLNPSLPDINRMNGWFLFST